MTLNIGVLCSGRGSNLMAIHQAIESGRLSASIEIVIADQPETGAVSRAREAGLYATFVPRAPYHANRDGFERRLVEMLNQCAVELVVLAGFERLVGPVLLNAFPGRVINLHPALLPSFAGLSVWPSQIEHGVKISGATVHFVDEGLDSGPIIIQGAVPLMDSDSPDDLAARIRIIEHLILPQAIKWCAQKRLSLDGRRVLLAPAKKKTAPHQPQPGNCLIWPPLD